jgi:hypothetical protein
MLVGAFPDDILRNGDPCGEGVKPGKPAVEAVSDELGLRFVPEILLNCPLPAHESLCAMSSEFGKQEHRPEEVR